jgi:hypothetical protein
MLPVNASQAFVEVVLLRLAVPAAQGSQPLMAPFASAALAW